MKRLGQYGIEMAQLDNGLKIVLKRMPCPRVYISFLIECGPLYESKDEQGVSHFLEHLIGEEGRVRNRNSRLFYKINRDGGDIDASADYQFTFYKLHMHRRFWFRGFRMFLDSIAKLDFSQNDFSTEQSRIFAEMKDECSREMVVKQRIFPDHPLSRLIEGTKQSILAMTPAAIHSWHRKFYFPGRMIVIVVGNVSMRMVVRAIKSSQVFAIENGKDVPLPPERDFNWDARGDISGFSGNWQKVVYPMPPFGDAQELFLFFLISNYIFDDISALSLNREVAFETGIYSPLCTEFTITSCCSFFEIALGAPSQKVLVKTGQKFFRWIERMVENGIGKDRFRRLYLQRVADIESLSGADWLELLNNAVCWGVIGNLEVFLDPAYIDKKGLDMVAGKYFGGNYLVFCSQ